VDLQADSLAAAAKALAYQNAEYAFRLGQKVRHAIFGMNHRADFNWPLM
jgi:hypothetical protein